jgi:hypothetical protein
LSIFFYYYDDIWTSCNWVIEPPNSLEYYYREQAQKIRDEYEYVILCYSGGYDSTNILETFYYNNIKLDKILITGPFSQDSSSGTDENHNGETYLNSFPYINELGLNNITEIFDYTKMYGSPENFSLYRMGDNWINEIGTRFSPHHWFWRDLEEFVVPTSHKDKKVAIIFGKEKPHLLRNYPKNNINVGFRFFDIALSDYGNPIKKFNNIDRINFSMYAYNYTII